MKEHAVSTDYDHTVELFWSFRSPYAYLAMPRLDRLRQETGVAIEMRVVHPNILRNPNYFKTMNPLARPYFMRDTKRMADYLGMPFRRPLPDPIEQNPETLEVAPEQPVARWLGQLGVAATEAGRGFEFCWEVAQLLWNGQTDQWQTGDHLRQACARAGLDWTSLQRTVHDRQHALEAQLQAHAQALTAAGHWGVPTMTYRGEVFFGQDRIDVLTWHIKRSP
jgi:2-hydroxychromene-2-carboxylate isomerase